MCLSTAGNAKCPTNPTRRQHPMTWAQALGRALSRLRSSRCRPTRPPPCKWRRPPQIHVPELPRRHSQANPAPCRHRPRVPMPMWLPTVPLAADPHAMGRRRYPKPRLWTHPPTAHTLALLRPPSRPHRGLRLRSHRHPHVSWGASRQCNRCLPGRTSFRCPTGTRSRARWADSISWTRLHA
ncbi:hypothetical protein BCR44DRAFT_1439239 [Catenaria anguillulae PL171]|uniref:Uncharacterized protein n=1 Tax=Catenaria anguillulae PL171 TaxID=765915 RepID=A0A1Y2HGG0_9FUNG|nr:hypothetical protein BCR44DRAFT_1439239 [Catenaria anguillulae PL171]